MDKRILIVLLIGVLAKSTFSAPQKSRNQVQPQRNDPTQAKILKQINNVNDDGSYTFGYEADDGSFKVETRSKDGVVKGKYGFIDPNGELKTIEYSAGEAAVKNLEDQTLASATDTKTVKADSSEDDSGNGSGENSGNSKESSGEDDSTFNSFGSPTPTKASESELTNRQGKPSESGSGSNSGDAGNSKYVRQSQIQQPQYIPTTHLTGGQFRGPAQPQFQQQQQFSPQQQFIGGQPQYIPQGQPQYIPQGQPQFIPQGQPQQFQGFAPQQRFIGQQPYPGVQGQGFVQGQGQGFTQGQGQRQDQFGPQQQFDDEGFINGPPPQGGFFEPTQQQGFGRASPIQGQGQSFQGIDPALQFQGGSGGQGQGFQQFGSRPDRFSSGVNTNAISGTSRPFVSSDSDRDTQDFGTSADLDGFSEDADQDGFVDRFPGTDSGRAGQTGGRPSSVTTSRNQDQYTPQALVPQRVLQQGRQFQGGSGSQLGVSPYDEQELQQIYQQPASGRGQSQFGTPYNQFAGQEQPFDARQYNPQHQQFNNPARQAFRAQPVQQFSPQQFNGPQFGGPGPQYQPRFGAPGPQFIPGGFPGQQFQGQGQGQIPPQFIQGGQGQPQGSLPQFNSFVGGVGPGGFPIGGPQPQFSPQQQFASRQGQGQDGQGAQLSPTPGAVQVVSASDKSANN